MGGTQMGEGNAPISSAEVKSKVLVVEFELQLVRGSKRTDRPGDFPETRRVTSLTVWRIGFHQSVEH